MSRQRLILAGIMVAACARAWAAEPQRGWAITERPDGSRLVNGIWLRPSVTCDWADLVRFTIQDGQLIHDATTGDRLRMMLRGRRDVLVRVRSAPDLWRIDGAREPDGFVAKFLDVRDKRDPAKPGVDEWYRPTLLTVDDTDEVGIAGDGLCG